MSQQESNVAYNKKAIFYDQLLYRNKERRKKTEFWTKKQINAIKKLIKDRKIDLQKSIVLDIGGGTGRLAYPLSLLCEKVILIEPSLEMLEIAKAKLDNIKHGEIDFVQGGFLDIKVPPNSVNVIVSINDPFQHILEKKEQLQALKNMKTVLKPGGILILEMMNFFSLIYRAKKPDPLFWKTEDYEISLFIQHKKHNLKGIWIHIENFYLKDLKTKKIEHREIIHKLKNISLTELELLLERTGFENIQAYPSEDLNAEDGNRFLVVTQKTKDI